MRERDRQIERERERCEMVKSQKWYYLCNMRSAYFPFNRRLHRERKRERDREREQEGEREKERERLKERERCETVKIQKWYYLCNMISAYFPISMILHRERAREREREREKDRDSERERQRERVR